MLRYLSLLAGVVAEHELALQELKFSYGVLDPPFDPATHEYTLNVPACDHSNLQYHLLPLDVSATAGFGLTVEAKMGEFSESSEGVLLGVLSERSGVVDWGFEKKDLTVIVSNKKHASSHGVTYTIHVVGALHDQDMIDQKCLLCPAPDEYVATTTSTTTTTTLPPISCPVANSVMTGTVCACKSGYMGDLELVGRVWKGTCIKEPPRGAWPCQGELPFSCGRCPSCQEAKSIMEDIGNSCAIPDRIPSKEFIWHTEDRNIATVHPDLKEHICISPICRWRIELGYNSFATCQTLGNNFNGKSDVSWRGEIVSLQEVKHWIMVFHSAKNSCHVVRAAQNVHESTMIYQKFLVTGVDIRSDATMRQGELAFRQAFSKMLQMPLRRLDVQIEPEICTVDPVCDHQHCGYGECVPWKARLSADEASGSLFAPDYAGRHPNRLGEYGYRCLCNECFDEVIQSNGIRTCVRDETCVPKNYCDPNPCKCGGQCIPNPEAAAKGEPGYTCNCEGSFSGPTCDTLDCPTGYQVSELTVTQDKCEQKCEPVMREHACENNPCLHGGKCHVDDKAENGYVCLCPVSFGGARCESVVCPSGFKLAGDICVPANIELPKVEPQVHCDICEGENNPCMHDGYCQVIDSDCNYQCSCTAGWTGDVCDTQQDVCAYHVCQGSETCVPNEADPKGYVCEPAGAAIRLLHYRSPSGHPQPRRLDAGPGDLQFDWENGGALPTIRPLLPGRIDAPKEDEYLGRCTVWQNSKNYRSEVTLSVKCPKDDVDKCTDMLSQLDTRHKYGDWADLEGWTRYNCVGTHINATSEPTEERLLSSCPSNAKMGKVWDMVHDKCSLVDLDIMDWEGTVGSQDMEVVVSDAGVETMSDAYRPLVCGSGICRALIIKYAAMFKSCRNSAPGKMGLFARRAKALKNFASSCANPEGDAVLRQQVKVQGLLDELSEIELSEAENFVRKLVLEAVGSSMTDPDQLLVLARPALDNLNTINSRVITPMDEFAPTLLPLGRNPVIHAPCIGLCVVATQPGPDSVATSDPSARMFMTFNEPILAGPCFTGDYGVLGNAQCEVTFEPLLSSKGKYVLTKLDDEIVFAGETLSFRPPFSLKPFANYTVTLSPGLVQSPRGDVMDVEYKYWFQTGAPRGSVVQMSIAVGCYDEGECTSLSEYMKPFADAPTTTLVDPLKKHIHEFRQSMTASLLAQLEAQADAEMHKALLEAQGLPTDEVEISTVSPEELKNETPLLVTTTTTTTTEADFSLFGGDEPVEASSIFSFEGDSLSEETTTTAVPFHTAPVTVTTTTTVGSVFGFSFGGSSSTDTTTASSGGGLSFSMGDEVQQQVDQTQDEDAEEQTNAGPSISTTSTDTTTAATSFGFSFGRRLSEQSANYKKHRLHAKKVYEKVQKHLDVKKLMPKKMFSVRTSGGSLHATVPGLNPANFEADLKHAQIKHKVRQIQKSGAEVPEEWVRRLQTVMGGSGATEPASASSGNPVVEIRGSQDAAWIPPPTWIEYVRVVPFVCLLAVVAMAYNGQSVQWWIHDLSISNGGYVQRKKDGSDRVEWVSFLQPDMNSWSRYMPPRMLWPIVTFVVIIGSGLLGFFVCSVSGGATSGLIGGCMTALASAVVFASFSIAVSVWVSPSTIPFFIFYSHPINKWFSVPMITGYQRQRSSKTSWPNTGPFNCKETSMVPFKPLPQTPAGQGGLATMMGGQAQPLMTAQDRREQEYKHAQHHGSHQEDPNERQVAEWFQKQAEITMHDDQEHTVLRIPKAPGLGRVQPDRLQEPFAPATRNAEKAFILGALCTIFSLVLIPMNGIHLYEGQFIPIMCATGGAVALSIFAKMTLQQIAKSHCRKKVEGLDATMTRTGKKYQVLATGMGVSPLKSGRQ